jgi:hypothetical protein
MTDPAPTVFTPYRKLRGYIDWAPIDARLAQLTAPLSLAARDALAAHFDISPETLRGHLRTHFPHLKPEAAPANRPAAAPIPRPAIVWCACGKKAMPLTGRCLVCESNAREAARLARLEGTL